MDNLWSVLAQTLALSVAAAVLLAAKRLFLDKLSPRWQYGVWAILALRALLPAGLLGRTLVPGGRVVLEAAWLQVELPLSSVLTDPYGVTEVLAPVPLFPFGLPVPGSITDVLFYVYAAGVLLLALWFFLSYARLRAAIRRGLSPAPEVLAQVEGVAARYGLKAPRRVVVLPGLRAPSSAAPCARCWRSPTGRWTTRCSSTSCSTSAMATCGPGWGCAPCGACTGATH